MIYHDRDMDKDGVVSRMVFLAYNKQICTSIITSIS